MQLLRTILLAIVVAFVLVACSQPSELESNNSEESPAAEVTESVEMSEELIASGETLFTQTLPDIGFACATCHHPTDARLIGPGLAGLTNRVETYDLNVPPEEYVRESILNPRAYIAPGSPEYPAAIMPVTYADLLSDDQLDALIAYVLSL